MTDTKVTKAKRIIAKLSWEEFLELKVWFRKKKDELYKIERARRKQEHCDSIKALPPGTLVIFTDTSWQRFCGRVGKIVRHQERGSIRTIIDFGEEDGLWKVPRCDLHADVSLEKIKQLKLCSNLSGVVNKALNNIEG